jgi:two-component system, OmpR family, sensor kinase
LKPRGLRFKLTLLYTAIFTVFLSAFFVLAYYLLANQLEATATDELVELATGLRGYLRFENNEPVLSFNADDPEVAYFVRIATRYYQIYDLSTGAVLAASPDVRFLGLEVTLDELRSMTEFPVLTDVQTDKGRLRFFNDRVISNAGTAYLIQVGVSLEPVQLALQHFIRLSLWLLPLGVLVAAAAGWFMTGRTLSPIKIITRAAHDIEVSHLNRRLPILGTGDEIDELAATFNQAFSRLEKAVGEMKQFTASMAHELRTPLTALRGEAELALLHSQSIDDCKSTLANQIEQLDKLNNVIHQLLTLAQAESGELQMAREQIDVTSMLKGLVETFSLVAAEKRVSLELELIPDLTVTGDRQWLERAIINLIDNAIKYTPAGGRVSVSGRRENDKIVLEVLDNGRGISQEALPHIFERFYRADPSRSKDIEGIGLGLSLVKWIVDQHQGTIDVRSQPDHGTRFRILLPEH